MGLQLYKYTNIMSKQNEKNASKNKHGACDCIDLPI